MKKLKVKFDKLERVVHMADLHVRLFKRHGEYKKSFKTLYNDLKKQDLTNGIIVIAGDILHAKLDLSPEMIEVTSEFLQQIVKIAPTIIIDGNHDLNLSNPHRMNSLYPMIKNINHPDLHYLSESGIYRVADTEFALFGISDKPDQWPDVSKMTSEIKIGLYHGPVYGAKTDTNYTISSRHVESSKFDGLDVVMLGDIHKFQQLQERNISKNKPTIVYCGSLIQQNHGETLRGHGYVMWELPSCEMKFHEVENDTGYVTLEVNSTNISKFSVPNDLPKNIRLRLFSSVENTKLKKIISVIKKKYTILDVSVIPNKFNTSGMTTHADTFDIGDLTDINVQNSLMEEWLRSTYPIISDEIIESISKINKRMNELINYSDQSRNIHWKPLMFKFSNLFSFDEDNCIDFTKLTGTNGIFAPNASGKSSSMEAVIFALFDKTPRAYRGDYIMNIRKKTFECELSFDVNGTVYVIKRRGKKNNKGAVRVDVEFWKENGDGTVTIMNGEDRFGTNANIRAIVGTYEDFILTTLSGQTGNSVFIDKSNSERKMLLNQFMGLNIFEQLAISANEESKQLQGVLKKFSREDFTDQLVSLQNYIEQHTEDLLSVETQINGLDRDIETSQTEIEELSSQKINIPVTMVSKNVLLREKTLNKNKIDPIERNIGILKTETTLIKNKIDLAEIKLRSVDLDMLEKSYNSYQNYEKTISKLEHEYTLLSTSIDNKLNNIKQLSKFKYNPDCEICVDNNKSKLEHIGELNLELTELTTNSSKIVSDKTRIQQEMGLLEVNYRLYTTTISEIKSLEEYKIDYRLHRNDIDGYENQLYKILGEIDKINTQITQVDQYQETLMKNKYLDEKIVLLKQAQLTLKEQISKLNIQKMDFHSDLKVNENNRSSIIQQLEDVTKIEQEFEAFRYYLDAVGKDGLPYTLISKTIPNIEAEINNILTQVVPFSIALDVDGKNFGGRIVYDHERSWPLENSSGMERFISSLAIRVALLKASNLPKSNFLIIDEGMGSLDSEYLHGMQMMFDLLKTQFDYVIVISHLDNIRDMVDTSLEILNVNGYSHINTMN